MLLTLKKWEDAYSPPLRIDYYHTQYISNHDTVPMGVDDIVQSNDYDTVFKVTQAGDLPKDANLNTTGTFTDGDLIMEYQYTFQQYTCVATFTAHADQNLSDYLIREGTEIHYGLEDDRPLSYQASSMDLVVAANSILTSEFTVANLDRYIYGFELVDDGTNRFVGMVNRDSITFDKLTNTWHISLVDWFKFHYDYVSRAEVQVNYTSTDNFLSTVFDGTIPSGTEKIINSVNVEVTGETWTGADQLLDSGLCSIQKLIDEARKYFSAYMFVDANYNMYFIPYYEAKSISVEPIDDQIVRGTYEEIPFIERQYEAVVTHLQKGEAVYPDTTRVWVVLYMKDGSMESTHVNTDEALDAVLKDMVTLDLRNGLGISDDGTTLGPEVLSHYFFTIPSEGSTTVRLNPKLKYQYLLQPGKEVRCSVRGKNIRLMEQVSIGSTTYQVHEITENLVNDVQELSLRYATL